MRVSGGYGAVNPHDGAGEPEHDHAATAATTGAPAASAHAAATARAATVASTGPSALHALPAPGKPGPVLGATSFHVGAAGVQSLAFDASSPGNSFGAKDREATAVSVYVNGRYHSTETILSERANPATGFGAYKVNLGTLPPGDYKVEIRSANDLAGKHSHPAAIRAGSIQPAAVSGLDAEIDRYAPLLVTRAAHDGGLLGLAESLHLHAEPRPTVARTDVPLRMRAEVLGDPAGYHTLAYHVTFSDEDGGTPDAERLRTYGRTTDDEWVYKVLVDGSGKRVSAADLDRLRPTLGPAALPAPEMFQYGNDGPVVERHVPKAFDGMHAGDRPVLRVNSMNNNFAVVKPGDKVSTAVWSPAVDFDASRRRLDGAGHLAGLGAQSSLDVIARFPWVGQVSSEEIQREGH